MQTFFNFSTEYFRWIFTNFPFYSHFMVEEPINIKGNGILFFRFYEKKKSKVHKMQFKVSRKHRQKTMKKK